MHLIQVKFRGSCTEYIFIKKMKKLLYNKLKLKLAPKGTKLVKGYSGRTLEGQMP